MDLPEALEVLHQPVRLRLMALLHARGDVGAAGAREALGATAGNLDAHARRLEEAGFLAARKELLRSGFEARYRITPAGRAAFEAYLAWLEEFLAKARDKP
ncbi:MAG: transcriptional regulator [Halobacteriales archaeon]|nr:transcriptional regulator [Halobacteriales archaeon]